ncbi:unnamed protein product [Fusarium langsethiae]|nr:unnamed protein product [Fusarium langsethiae]
MEDDGSATVEVNRNGIHAQATSRHQPTQPIVTVTMEEWQMNVNQANDATEGQSLQGCLSPNLDSQEDHTGDVPSGMNNQLGRDSSVVGNFDDEPTSANNQLTQSTTTQDSTHQEDTLMTDSEPQVTQRTAILAPAAHADNRRPATPNLARQENNLEVPRHDDWSSQSSDTSGTVSPTCSTTSQTDTVCTRLTTPDSTSMGEKVDQSPSSDNSTPISNSRPDLADESLYERYIIESEDTPTLSLNQLGKHMPKTLNELSETPSYANRARLPWITEQASHLNIKEELKPEGDPDVQFNKFERKDENGMIVSRDDPIKGKRFEWPEFEKRGSSMTARQASRALEQFFADPKEAVSYYCGLMKSILWDLCPLYSGEQLDIKELTHVNELFTHLGKKNSATAMHQEDDRFGSVNVGFIGIKLFLRILTEDTEKFEEWVRANYACKPCPQFVRHLNIFFEPKRLEAAGIRFEILIQQPGDLIETKPHQYHQVLNVEDSLAISINFLAPGITPNFRDANNPLEVCDGCGLKGLLGRPGFHVKWVGPDVPPRVVPCKRKAHSKLSKGPAKTTRAGTATQRELVEIQKELVGIQYRHPQIDRRNLSSSALAVYKHVAIVQSRDVLGQFTDLVRLWRQEQEQSRANFAPDLTISSLDQAVASVKHYSGKTKLHTFCLRLSQKRLAQVADKNKSPARKYHSSKFLDDLASRNHITKQELQGHIRDGLRWDRLCKPRDGLLAFIPLDTNNCFGITKKDWAWLGYEGNDELVQVFHQLLDDSYIGSLCAAGKLFEEMISGDTNVVFTWEESELDLAGDNVHVQLQEHKTVAW